MFVVHVVYVVELWLCGCNHIIAYSGHFFVFDTHCLAGLGCLEAKNTPSSGLAHFSLIRSSRVRTFVCWLARL